VLDEVDAPLDDYNVERFCDLLGEMRKRADTRFVIITHNPITMARMDRLFGVTMAERGVSQIVSVELAEVERFGVGIIPASFCQGRGITCNLLCYRLPIRYVPPFLLKGTKIGRRFRQRLV
jgi:hypothetical protein